MADRHVIIKNACKEYPHQLGKAVTFMAKWTTGWRAAPATSTSRSGRRTPSRPLFFDKKGDHGMWE